MKHQYIWQNADLRKMTWQDNALSSLISDVSLRRGSLLGRLSMFGFKEQGESMLDSLTEEIIHSSEIEGERLNRDSVRSSIARQLGLAHDGLPKTDHYIEGVVQVMLDATQHFQESLTKRDCLAGILPYSQQDIVEYIRLLWVIGEKVKRRCR